MIRTLEDSVVVVTGATSGTGRATAVALAGRGARLVLAARDEATLHEVVAECGRAGTSAIAVPTDIGVADDVDRLEQAAVDAFGRIDTWVNAAAVLVASVLGDETVEEIERLVQTNVLGTTLASRAALRRFRAQGDGVLINVSSVLGLIPNPLVPTYTMSKFAVRGLSLSLHYLAGAWPGVRVCTVLPGPIDTPMFERAANHLGRGIRAVPPAAAPERVAAVIVSCARRPRRQVVVGWTARLIVVAHHVLPRFTEWVTARAAAAMLVRSEPAPPTSGDLFEPSGNGQVHGGWRRGACAAGPGNGSGGRWREDERRWRSPDIPSRGQLWLRDRDAGACANAPSTRDSSRCAAVVQGRDRQQRDAVPRGVSRSRATLKGMTLVRRWVRRDPCRKRPFPSPCRTSSTRP